MRAYLLFFSFILGCAVVETPTEMRMTTWSIAAMDLATGDVGVAAASCVPDAHADALAALVPGVGVAVTQAVWNLENRNIVYDALRNGSSADRIIELVADRQRDEALDDRQYGVVTLTDGDVRIAGFTGEDALDWSGIQQDRSMAVTVQGNTLVGESVVAEALAAYLSDEPSGQNWLSDRLMRALEAGSAAGGDVRCNNSEFTSTAATAFILVARTGDDPYAAESIRVTDQGTVVAPWLAISEAGPKEGPNPILEVRRRYDSWRSSR
jgi:uncharacterized Ntn-hydrolase superfamily protein